VELKTLPWFGWPAPRAIIIGAALFGCQTDLKLIQATDM
jgi:hypothetical protein